MTICYIHNVFLKTVFSLMGISEDYKPDDEVSLGMFIIELMGIIIFPTLIIFGILFRIYSFIPDNYNLFSNITFKCKRNKEKFKLE